MTDHPTTEPTTGQATADWSVPTTPGKPGGRFVTWLAFLLGVVGSVAANVAHTAVPSDRALKLWVAAGHKATDWSPPVGAMLFAAFAPVALMLAIEVLSRVPWPVGLRWAVGRWAGSAVVAAVAAVVSYRHMRGLLLAYGEPVGTATLLPLAVDGLMVVASVALLALSDTKRSAHRSAATVQTTSPVAVANPNGRITQPPTTVPAASPAPTKRTDQPAASTKVAARPVAAAKKPTKATTKPGVRIVWSATVAADVATIRDRYGDDVPGRNVIVRELGWHPEKATNARNAALAGADRTEATTTPTGRKEPADDPLEEHHADHRIPALAGA